jgi:triphosphoribosyl-dephospho-CoA synthetase
MYRTESCESTRRERDDLRYQVEDLRADQKRRREQEEQDRGRRRRQLKEEISERLASVDNWPEAFQLGIPLIVREAQSEEAVFNDWLKQVQRAREIHGEVMADVEKQITALRLQDLSTVADRLVAEFGEIETAQAVRDNRPDFLTYW